MTRYLTILGLAAVAAVLTLAALSTTDAGAVEEQTGPAFFTALKLDVEETAKIDGEQIGTNTITIGTLPALTCSSVKYNGVAATEGAGFEQLTISPEYGTCHVAFLGTKTTTVTMNGCTYQLEALTTLTESGEAHLTGGTAVACPAGKGIEVHVYNTEKTNDEGAGVLCAYEIPAQSGLTGITLTNKANTPSSVDDVVVDYNVGSIKVFRKAGAICGPAELTATYKGEATLKATNAASELIEIQGKTGKHFFFYNDPSVAIGESGSAEFVTEKKPIKCTNVKYETGQLKGNLVFEFFVKPTYSDCKFGALDAHVKFEGCEYKHTIVGDLDPGVVTTATLTIVCGVGGPIKIEVTDANKQVTCTLTFGPQTAATSDLVDLKNVVGKKAAQNYVNFKNTIKGLSYEVKGDPDECGKNNELLTGGELLGEINVKAYNDAKKTRETGVRVMGLGDH